MKEGTSSEIRVRKGTDEEMNPQAGIGVIWGK